jgi:hypothetical protein
LGYGLLVPFAFYAGRGLLSAVPPARRDWWVHGAAAVALIAVATGLYVVPGGKLRPLIALLPLGGWAMVLAAIRRREQGDRGNRTTHKASACVSDSGLLLTAWVLGGLAAAYLPIAFQRKMIMGTHLPLSILAGLAVAAIAERREKCSGGSRSAAAVAAGLVALLSVSSVRYLIRDVATANRDGTTSTGAHPVYWDASDVRAWQWLGEHTPANAALLTFPLRGVIAPAFSGRAVYAGHWGETPAFTEKVRTVRDFYVGAMSSEARRRFLRENGLTHVLIGPVETMLMTQASGAASARTLGSESFLLPVFTEGKTTLYEVEAP